MRRNKAAIFLNQKSDNDIDNTDSANFYNLMLT